MRNQNQFFFLKTSLPNFIKNTQSRKFLSTIFIKSKFRNLVLNGMLFTRKESQWQTQKKFIKKRRHLHHHANRALCTIFKVRQTYRSGFKIARCRSTAIAVSVKTDTLTLTNWTKGQNGHINSGKFQRCRRAA